ncbi:GreA/GreB family elongation factor [Alkalihalobacterium chitinilyticum]|uniref:GreA/GreB family elongation factor n=1 Tax=Alkalihalobacterium chitinilyticum TaxID=2980103 RepID=A0ABT5VKS0_9BACI|nr:GreA/GreB family elongation factor [Alkalihalobacterium chitinilyticum]MDE5416029.1 GreA/GreB family elongation factor [Alkalihalobacterium chitinilyticum]
MILRNAVINYWMKNRAVAQIHYLKKNKVQIIEDFNEEEVSVRVEQFLVNYIDSLLIYSLKGNHFKEFPSLPFVMIDSRVTLYYLNSETQVITICMPEYENEEMGYFSFLSPIGLQLLLKQVGDSVTLGECSKLQDATIQSIEFSSVEN